MKLSEKIKSVRESGIVKRCHTLPVHRQQTLADHQWNVAQLILLLFPDKASKNLIVAALNHDIPERWIGDIPSRFKAEILSSSQFIDNAEAKIQDIFDIQIVLNSEEHDILTFCDMLDFFLFCQEERNFGNSSFGEISCRMWDCLCRNKLFDNEMKKIISETLKLGISESHDWYRESFLL